MKKVLSLVLVIAMVLSSMSFAFAGTFSDVTGDYTKAVEALASLDVIDGYEDGTFRPANTITRAELAKLLVTALGYGDLAASATSNFSDTQGHWADGDIAVAYGIGLVVGYPNGTFLPNNPVSYNEAITMVVRALGYTDASLKGTWPTNYSVKAIDLGLTDDVVMNKAAADRGGVAQIIYNALEADLVEINEDNIAKATDEMLIDKIASYEPAYEVTEAKIDPEDKNFASEFIDLTPYMYQSIKAYLNDDDQVVYVKGTNNLVMTGVLDAAGDLTTTTLTVEDAEDDNYAFNIVTGSAFMLNGAELAYTDVARAKVAFVNEDVKVTVVLDAEDDDSLKSGLYDVKGVVAEKQTKVVQIVDEYVTGKSKIDSISLPVDDDNKVDLEKVTVTGDAESLEDIQEDDIVVVFAADGNTKTKLVVTRDVVEGTVTRVSGTTTFYVDGTKYVLNGAVSKGSLELGYDGIFYLDQNGEIAAFEGQTTTAKYAVLVGVENGDTKESFGSVSVDDYPQVKLATSENETVVYDVYVKLNSTSHKITDSADIIVNGATSNFVSDTTTYGAASTITTTTFAALGQTVSPDSVNKLVKYKLNADGQVTEIKVVGEAVTFDEEDSDYIFASNAVIFDANDDYAVISEDRLKATGDALVSYNTDGEIAAMVTIDVKDGATTVYGYVDAINDAYNADEDEVQVFVAYINGEKVEYLSDEDYAIAADSTVYAFGLDGDVITNVADPTSTAAVTVTDISTSTNSLVAGEHRYFLTDAATILQVNDADDEDIIDLYDIEGKAVTLYMNADNDVTFIVYDNTTK